MWNTFAKHGMGFLARRRDAKARAAWDRYNNEMAALQAAQSQNTITENVAANRVAYAEEKLRIQKNRLKAEASASVAAAAAGVAGGSVDSVLFDINRSAGDKLATAEDRFTQSLLVTDQQRQNVQFQKTMATKQITQGPSFIGAIAGAGLDILGDRADAPTSRGTNLGGATQTQSADGWSTLRNMLKI